MMLRSTLLRRSLVLGASSLAFSLNATAQEAGSEPAEDDRRLQTVTVTAQGREESLQDVGVAVTALSGQDITTRGIIDIESLVPETPGVTLAESPFQRTVAIRGLGSTGGNLGIEQSAPFFIDGVFGGRSGQFLAPFFDLEAVEIIRGPQAIFFGKNATAGAVSIKSARPTDDFLASLSAGYEIENEGSFGEAVISGPFTDTLRGRLAVRYTDRGDYLRDTSTGGGAGGYEETAIRGGLEWDLSSDIEAYLKYEHAEREASRRFQLACANPEVTEIAGPFGAVVECVLDDRLSSGAAFGPLSQTYPPGGDQSENETENVALQVDWALGAHSLELISGYSSYGMQFTDGLDRSAIGLAASTTDETFEQWSQEVRLISPSGGQFEYVLGALYLEQTHEALQSITQPIPSDPMLLAALGLTTPPNPPFLTDVIDATQEAEAYSLFAELTWNFTDSFRVSAGARYTSEEKDFDPNVFRYFGPVATQTTVHNFASATADQVFTFENPGDAEALRRDEESLDPVVTAEWEAADDVLLYATYAKGTKAGGYEFFARGLFLPLPANFLSIEEEEATNYELGFKSTLAEGRARLNGAVFLTEIDGFQNQVVNTQIIGFETFNADAEIFGVEMDGVFNITDTYQLGGSFSYLDTEYKELFTGNPLPFAPEFSGNLYLAGHRSLGSTGWQLNTRLQANHTGEMSFDGTNAEPDRADAYTLIDLRIGLESERSGWEIAVNAKNLTDEDDILLYSAPTFLSNQPQYAAANPRGPLVGEGRTIMLQVRKDF